MTIEKTVIIDVAINEFDFKDICKAFEHGSSDPKNAKLYEDTLDTLDLLAHEDMKEWVYQMDRETFQELYEIMTNDFKYLTMED